jgi:hypothetical protein
MGGSGSRTLEVVDAWPGANPAPALGHRRRAFLGFDILTVASMLLVDNSAAVGRSYGARVALRERRSGTDAL